MDAKTPAVTLAVALAAACAVNPPDAHARGSAAGAKAGKAPDVAAQLNAMQARMNALEAQNRALQAELDTLKPELVTLKQQVAASSTARATAQSEADAIAKVATDESSGSAENQVAKADTSTSHTQDTGITLGGAVRFQYSAEGYNKGNRHRRGDIDFDIFRLDLQGKVHGIVLDAQWRWFQYMSAIQHAWIGYDFTDTQQLQIGLTRIPFGNQPFNSHSYFFSSNYYLGLEDTYAAGAEYVYAGGPWNVQLAFFKNDATGGVDGGGNRTHSYSYDILGVRTPGEDIFAKPAEAAGSVDSVASRVGYTLKRTPDFSWEVAGSALYGGIASPDRRIGHYSAFALSSQLNWKRWNFQAEAVHYGYHTNTHAREMAVGAYAFYDTIAAIANTYSFNVLYHQPVAWGPVESLDFYNDYSIVTNKSGRLPNTIFDVLGVGVSAGDLYTYIDFLTGRNQPFDGGSMAGNGKTEHRLNINFGFYF